MVGLLNLVAGGTRGQRFEVTRLFCRGMMDGQSGLFNGNAMKYAAYESIRRIMMGPFFLELLGNSTSGLSLIHI